MEGSVYEGIFLGTASSKYDHQNGQQRSIFPDKTQNSSRITANTQNYWKLPFIKNV
jgi:hypothetical protein